MSFKSVLCFKCLEFYVLISQNPNWSTLYDSPYILFQIFQAWKILQSCKCSRKYFVQLPKKGYFAISCGKRGVFYTRELFFGVKKRVSSSRKIGNLQREILRYFLYGLRIIFKRKHRASSFLNCCCCVCYCCWWCWCVCCCCCCCHGQKWDRPWNLSLLLKFL